MSKELSAPQIILQRITPKEGGETIQAVSILFFSFELFVQKFNAGVARNGSCDNRCVTPPRGSGDNGGKHIDFPSFILQKTIPVTRVMTVPTIV